MWRASQPIVARPGRDLHLAPVKCERLYKREPAAKYSPWPPSGYLCSSQSENPRHKWPLGTKKEEPMSTRAKTI